MKNPLLFLTILLVLISACQPNNHTSTPTSSRLPEPDIAERLKYQKAVIDRSIADSNYQPEMLVKLTEEVELIVLKDSVLPDETETSFNIYRDSLQRIVAITESPYSQSGDWFLTLTHYFDNNGQTFAFERQTNFFNSGCTNGVAYETKTDYYTDDFTLIGKDYKLVDEQGRNLKKDSCTFLYEYDHKVLPGLKEFLQLNSLQKDRQKR
jgi:hypothetical protein